ncbi:MAG: LOG family protein [Phycisphaerales bacterium]|nr:LOG family protein [Phycisphaerae bacterium]NNF41854.1 LOG family protein [Phycisphaerales bacterium]NNM27377.1 LOG family protein [Phycisphaerales bacterium]
MPKDSRSDQTDRIRDLVQSVGGDPDSFDGRLVGELIATSLKMIPDGHDTGQLKLINAALKEMRYAYTVFNRYAGIRKISIFGSARTPADHPDYEAARTFSKAMAANAWMSITGAGDGIMKAGHEGPQREGSFGLSIRLPFETTANEVIEGDPKLINFRYFFTRKLMFMSHADAVAVFPGGFGTQDELFESLVLAQTGKSNIVPIVLLEGAGGGYWKYWDTYVRKNLLDLGWVSPDDLSLYHIAKNPADGVEHVLEFYRVYHSSRYVQQDLVLRIKHPLPAAVIEQLNDEFGGLLKSGRITPSDGPLAGESDHPDLPRLVLRHTRNHFSTLRRLIDRINELGSAAAPPLGATGS